jgi:hypothetical protein
MNREAKDLGIAARERLDGVLRRFRDAWQRGERPELEPYLAALGPDERRVLLLDLAHEDLEFRLAAGEAVRVEAYLGRHPELREDRAAALGLIASEYSLRLRRQADLNPEEYLRRFPEYGEELSQRLRHAGTASTAEFLVAGSTPPTAGTGTPARSLPPLLGEYEVLERLGAGGMGEVYRARHRRLGKVVALKVLPTGRLGSAAALARFRRETEAVGSLDHPHLVEAHDAGEQDGIAYLVLKLIEGTDLQRLVQQRGPLPVAEACDLARQAALGLQHLHERGLVHRDVKPSNLMRTPAGTVKVLDLGLARRGPAADGAELTAPDTLLGTPDYLAPEQIDNPAGADGRADLYGLGATLFYLLTGKAPFAHHPQTLAKLKAHGTEAPPDVRSLRPEVPPAVAALLARLLAKRPEQRPATPQEVADALAAFAEAVPAPVPLRGAGRPRRWPLAVGVGVLLGALLLAGLAGLGRRRPETARSVPVPDEQPAERAAPARPLTVRLRVRRLVPDGFNLRLAGELGEREYRVRLNDRVQVEAELSEPAYAYLIAFNPADNPDDREQLVPQSEAGRPPDRRERLEPETQLNLNDGEGLQVFAVLASRQPLPAYAEWRKRRPPLTWRRVPATSGVVWRGDGAVVRGQYEGAAVRAREEKSDQEVVRDLARTLREMPKVEAVAVVGFAVDPAP